MPTLLTSHHAPDAPPLPAPGPEQGVIEEARRRQRQRRTRRTIVGLVGAVLIAGLAWALGGGGSNGARRHATPSERGTPTHALGARGGAFNVRLTPALRGGAVGWDVVLEGGVTGTMGGSGGTPTPSLARFGGVFTFRSEPPSEVTVTLATPQVAAVLVDGTHRVRTVAVPGLPYGLRVALV